MFKKVSKDFVKELPKFIVRHIVDRKLKEINCHLPDSVIDMLIDHITSGREESFSFESEENIDVSLQFTDGDVKYLNEVFDHLLEALPDVMLAAIEKTSGHVFRKLRNDWRAEYALQKLDVDEFCQRLEWRWGEAFHYLHMLLTACREIGYESFKRQQKYQSTRRANRRWILSRLHARACRVSEEILALIRSGFPDAAMSRWRTLHELAVVGGVVHEADEDLAERYIRHEVVDRKRQADEYDKIQAANGGRLLSKRERSLLDKSFDKAIDKFGPEFGGQYGWASRYLANKKPTFRDLQIAAGRAGWGGHYKLASLDVHATARSLSFNLCSMNDSDLLITGRSNAGLSEPGIQTAQTIVLVTSFYSTDRDDVDRIAEVMTLTRMRDAAAKAFKKAERRLEKEERYIL